MDKILIGADPKNPMYTFTDAQIKVNPVCVLSSALLMDELAIDQFSPVMYSEAYLRVGFLESSGKAMLDNAGRRFVLLKGGGFLDRLPYATPIWYYVDDVLMGKFYSKRVVRSGKAWFDVQAVSAIGVLDGQTHNGGLYSGVSFPDVAADIIGGSVSFSCADELRSLPVFGWLPKDTRRKNLHQLLFAYGVAIRKDENGNMVFVYPDTQTKKNIGDDRIFLGGSIDYMTPATRVDVTEHAFLKLPSDEEVTLFDNTDGSGVADFTTIDFPNAPIHDLTASGAIVVHESGVNYAVISGTGLLRGKRYTHTTKIKTLENASNGETKVVSVQDDTLVSVANSGNVAKRVLSYYGAARTIAADIVVDGEKPGDQIVFNNPFGDPETAFLSSMEVTSSSFLRAACELVSNYTPAWGGNNYSNAVVLTGSGSWVVEASTFRVMLVGGGSGGSSGGKGEDGGNSVFEEGNAGAGGVPGSAGIGGKILTVEMEVAVGTSISYSCGVGGAGGVCAGLEPTPGEMGGTTVFGAYSSANGLEASAGAVDLFSGEVYALPGANDGLSGANGADSGEQEAGSVVYDGVTYIGGVKGSDVEGWKNGRAFGGYGGGAAAGANGADGYNASTQSNNGYGWNQGGAGGAGGTAVDRANATQFGCGGDAGHGGGGGGAGGTATGDKGYYSGGNGGAGGMGGKGGDGAPGCIIVYY